MKASSSCSSVAVLRAKRHSASAAAMAVAGPFTRITDSSHAPSRVLAGSPANEREQQSEQEHRCREAQSGQQSRPRHSAGHAAMAGTHGEHDRAGGRNHQRQPQW